MKRKQLTLILFLILIISIFLSLHLLFRFDSKRNRWYQFKQLPENSIDILYMGNSHNMQGIIPKVVEDTLGLNGFTLGVPGESIKSTYFELVEALKTQSPTYIGIETYVFDVNMKGGDGYVFAFLDSIPFSKNALDSSTLLYSKSRAYNYFPAIRQHSMIWKQPEFIPSKILDYKQNKDMSGSDFSFYINSDGYFLNDTQIVNEKLQSINPPYEPIKQQNINQNTKYYLEKIISLCQKNKIQLFLFTMPEVRDELGFAHRFLDYQAIAEQYGLPYIDLAQEEYSIMHFADTNHLTQIGSLRATLHIKDFIANQYTLNIDKKIEKEYQQLNIDDYKIEEISWQFFHFEFISENGDLEKNDYTYTIDSNGKTFGGRPDGNLKAATIISFQEIGEYRINITIDNPKINYLINHNIIIDLPLK